MVSIQVQEHTEYNLACSNQEKAFVIPHGVDTQKFHPGLPTDFRQRHGIPADAFVVISVGTICYWHKRMDYVIREVAAVPDAWLVIVGQEGPDTEAIKALGQQLMADRIVFTTMPHDELPKAYAAADVFALGSLFETFGIVYIEAMAMGLPVISTNHPNQQSIIKDGVFIDMSKSGALTAALRQRDPHVLAELGKKGVEKQGNPYKYRLPVQIVGPECNGDFRHPPRPHDYHCHRGAGGWLGKCRHVHHFPGVCSSCLVCRAVCIPASNDSGPLVH